MKRWQYHLSLAVLLFATSCAQRILVQPTIDVTRYNRLAVLPFETDSFLSTAGNQLADEIIIDLLHNAPNLDVVERTRIDVLLQEQNLARQGLVNPDSAVSVGRMLGVNAVLTGSLSVSISDIRPATMVLREAGGVATVRLVDAETGKVVWSNRVESQYTTFVSDQHQELVSTITDQEMMQNVIQDLGRSLAQAFYPHYELQYR